MNPFAKISLLALGPALGLGIARFAYGLLLPPMKMDLGISYAQAGWLNTINAVGYILGALTAAFVARRLGTARTYNLGAVFTVLTVFTLGVVQGFEALSLFRLLSGVSGAWIFVAGGVIAAEAAAEYPGKSGVLIGVFYAGAGFGVALTGLVVPQWLEHFGPSSWRDVWVLLGVLGALFAVAGYTATPPDWTRAERSSARTVYRPFRHKWILGGYIAFGAGSIAYMTFIVAFLTSSGQPPWHISAFWVSIGLSSMTAPWLWSRLFARLRHARAFAILVGISAAGAIIPLISASFPAAIASAVVFGAVFFAVVAATTDFIRRNVGISNTTAAIGTFTVAFGTGQTLGPLVIGRIIDSYSSLTAGLAAGCAFICLGSALALLQRDQK